MRELPPPGMLAKRFEAAGLAVGAVSYVYICGYRNFAQTLFKAVGLPAFAFT